MALSYQYNGTDGYEVIGGCGDANITIPSTYNDGTNGNLPVKTIKGSAFAFCSSLQTIYIPDSIIDIEDFSFRNNTNLTSVRLSENLNTLGNGIFFSCPSLQLITIPDNITSFGYNAFTGCSSLTKINFTKNSKLQTLGLAVFSFCPFQSIILPQSVNSIGDYAFYFCSNLKEIIIPPNVTNLGERFFENCSSLKKVYFYKNKPSVGPNIFSNTSADLKIYRKKNFVTGWGPTLDGKPVVLWSDNIIKGDGGTGKLTTKKRN